jgi:radical SAM protein with 4Fe4S-binding SPASM domain
MLELRKARQMNTTLPGDKYLKSLQRLDADSDRINALIDELLKMGTRRFQFGGNGEPFMHKKTIEFMCRAKHAGSTCLVNTNGTLLDNSTIDELIKIGFDELRITTMAGTREMYARTHPGVANGTFDNLRENLMYLAEQKAALGLKHPKVTLVCIVVSKNCEDLFNFAELAVLVKAENVLYRPVDDIDDEGLSKLVPTKEQAIYLREQLIGVKAFLESKKIAHNINYFLKISKEQLDTTELYSIIPCYYGWLSVMIQADGNVYPCCRCYEPLGNVYEKEFHEIWYGNAYGSFRKQALSINRRKMSVKSCDCNSCVNHTANLRVYQLLHPIKGRSGRLGRLNTAFSEMVNNELE